MRPNRLKRATIGIVAAAATLGIILSVGLLTQATQASTSQVEVEFNQENLEKRSRESTAAALSNPQVKTIIDNAFSYAVDYEWQNNDHVIISTWGARVVTGDWSTGYDVNYQGGQIIGVDVSRTNNAIVSVQVSPRDDASERMTFTDNQKRAIEITLADSNVRQLTQDKQFYISAVRDYGNVQYKEHNCDPNGCAIVVIQSFSGESMSTIVNPQTGELHLITPGAGWRSIGR